jgi:predicted RNase H-like nuclease (RuvC/YqgF family)
MGAARFAAVQVLRDPVATKYLIDHHAYQKQIQEIKEKAAAELETSRRQLTSKLVAAHRELTASRSEVEHLKSANADLQSRLQEQDASMKMLQATNADLERQLRACGNITKFLAEIAHGETRGER